MGYPNDFIYLILAWSSLPYHENYMDQYVKPMQSEMNFIIINLTEPNYQASTMISQ